ncbi:class II glutamine amidotransferase [Pararobbsia silviterrae]|uniref:Class II glutamine amidotransferase n=1 Tax=Pararobbsia silviterrae TaxID=1792498 RepID=A0A494YEY0_9BURK|nr:class II glutamine amidotransferase [Pararobbsia silviterrae]RKP58923.1 class II glutamine amidotransferase [Pararobbsia silviterrae]
MCQLLGMNCATPTDVTFSFTGFAKRGGVTDHHADGWGIAFFEDKACRLFIDHESSATSPIAELVKRYPIKSKNTIAHIRKATQGRILLENCHPFQRELWGRHWIFAHNGDLQKDPLGAALPEGTTVGDTTTVVVQPTQFQPALTGVFQPVGTTDSEYAFCAILEGLRERFPTAQPPLPELFAAIQDLTQAISRHGVFNFLMSNGQALFAHCSTHLHYLVRKWPFSTAHLIDEDMTVDFANYTTPDDCVSVIATQPLTDNEVWTRLQPGECVMFQNGEPAMRATLPVPDAVRIKASQSPCAAGTIDLQSVPQTP